MGKCMGQHWRRMSYAVLGIMMGIGLALTPAYAGNASILSDDDLGNITAKGSDNDQASAEERANADGVQLNDTFQQDAAGVSVENSNRSTNNFQTNVVSAEEQLQGTIHQTNKIANSQMFVGNNLGGSDDDTAATTEASYANAGGVQLNGGEPEADADEPVAVQQNSYAMNLSNTNRSANNYQINVVNADTSQDQFAIYQSNSVYRSQKFVGNNTYSSDDDSAIASQDYANADGVQLNDDAQGTAQALHISNTNRSANNYQTNAVITGDQGQGYLIQRNSVAHSQKYVGNNLGGSDDDYAAAGTLAANADGVQLNDSAQSTAQALIVSNTNRSASNYQTNILALGVNADEGADVSAGSDASPGSEEAQWHIYQSNSVYASQMDVGNNVHANDADLAEAIRGANAGGVQGNGQAQSAAMALLFSNINRSASNHQINSVSAVGSINGSIRQSNIVRGSQIGIGNNR